MSRIVDWNVPQNQLITVVYGRTKRFEVEGTCVRQTTSGLLIKATATSDAFAGFGPRSQFIPYASLVMVRCAAGDGHTQAASRISETDSRRLRVSRELEGLLGGSLGGTAGADDETLPLVRGTPPPLPAPEPEKQ